MNFKQALIAHLQGERVEYKGRYGWEEFPGSFRGAMLGEILDGECDDKNEFRLALRTIMCNGVEVPAPESVAPKNGDWFYLPSLDAENLHICAEWFGCKREHEYLKRGLVYLNKDDAIARAKAMLLTQE